MTKLGKMLADFNTSLAAKTSVGGTTGTLLGFTDDDGVALPAGQYYLTIDGGNSQKEYWQVQLGSSGALTSIMSVSRQGVLTSGSAREHRVGATVVLTDFAYLLYIQNLLAGVDNFDHTVPLSYDGTASITTANQFATKAYVDATAVAGAPNASTTVKGIVQEATVAQINAGTASGSTGAELYMNPAAFVASNIGLAAVGNNTDVAVGTGNKFVTQTGLQHGAEIYAADSSVSANTITVTLAPVPTSYTNGFAVKVLVANAVTGATTININSLGSKNVKKYAAGVLAALAANDILASQLCTFVYDGTQFILTSASANTPATNLVGKTFNTTHSTGGTTTTTVAHGLGVVPKFVRAYVMSTTASSAFGIGANSTGCYDGTNQNCNFTALDTNGGSWLSSQDTTHAIHIGISSSGTANSAFQTGTITWDATNITITWANTNSPGTVTANIILEVFA